MSQPFVVYIDIFDALRFVLLFFLYFMSAFFSGTETALFSLSKVDIRKLSESKDKKSKKILRLLERPKEILITILIGNELVNILISIIIASLVYSFFGSKPWWYISGLSIGVTMPTLLLFGEVVPKSLALKNNVRLISTTASAIYFISKLFFPLRWAISKITSKFVEGTLFKETEMLEEDIRTLVDLSEAEGVLDKGEKELIHNVFDFGDTLVSDVMTVKTDIFSLPHDLPLNTLLLEIKDKSYSRIPIYKASPDNIAGILHAKELLGLNRWSDTTTNFNIENFLYPPYFVSLDTKADQLFKELNIRKLHMAIVVNENSKIVGLVTMEDLLEEVFGEIKDEYDFEGWTYDKISTNSYRISAKMDTGALNKLLALNINVDKPTTIGEYISGKLTNPPKKDDFIRIGNVIISIEKIQGSKILEILVTITGEICK